MPDHSRFFIVGGTLGGNAISYVQRPLDKELLRLTLAGEYCNVLAARQMGKSSLMVRTAHKLREHGVRPIIIDITAIGSSVSPSEWYFGLLSRLARELNLVIDEQDWWRSMEEKSPVQRFSDFLRDVILKQIHEPIVIFIDEIDSTLKLDFTDDFFAAIRAMYNARSRDEVYKRLTFVLLGVARPGDLIKDRTRTPYNIGVDVNVTDFQVEELESFRLVLDECAPGQGMEILQWVLDWTGGQPYLTQKLCAEMVEHGQQELRENDVSILVERIFLSDQARTETNLRAIRDRIQNSPHLMDMLAIYKRVLAGKKVAAEERSIAQNELKLTGLVRVSPQGTLQIRNRIYGHIFNATWVKNSIPANATNRRLIAVISSIAVVSLALAGFFYYRQVNQAVEVQAQTYVETFTSSSSQEVRISNLAGLFGLGGEYETQARGLFLSLPYEEQLALFDLATPDNVGNELVVVADGVYQTVENSADGNALLLAMGNALEGTTASGSVSLVIEINAWVDGREALAQEQYDVAVVSFSRAWDRSEQRGKPNLSVLLERASVYTTLRQYDNAMKDLEVVITQDAEKHAEIQSVILGNERLMGYFRENSKNYPNIANVISVSTPAVPSVPNTKVATPIPTPQYREEKVIFNSNFETALIDKSDFTDNKGSTNESMDWSIEADEYGNYYLVVSPPSGMVIQYRPLGGYLPHQIVKDNFVIEAKLKIQGYNSFFRAYSRNETQQLKNCTFIYDFDLAGGMSIYDGCKEVSLIASPAKIQQNTWHEIRIEFFNGQIREYLDGTLINFVTVEPMTDTVLEFVVSEGKVYYDDIRITTLAEKPNSTDQSNTLFYDGFDDPTTYDGFFNTNFWEAQFAEGIGFTKQQYGVLKLEKTGRTQYHALRPKIETLISSNVMYAEVELYLDQSTNASDVFFNLLNESSFLCGIQTGTSINFYCLEETIENQPVYIFLQEATLGGRHNFRYIPNPLDNIISIWIDGQLAFTKNVNKVAPNITIILEIGSQSNTGTAKA